MRSEYASTSTDQTIARLAPVWLGLCAGAQGRGDRGMYDDGLVPGRWRMTLLVPSRGFRDPQRRVRRAGRRLPLLVTSEFDDRGDADILNRILTRA